jgi:hypothetical protein
MKVVVAPVDDFGSGGNRRIIIVGGRSIGVWRCSTATSACASSASERVKACVKGEHDDRRSPVQTPPDRGSGRLDCARVERVGSFSVQLCAWRTKGPAP